MRDEKEEKKKQARSNKQTRQSNTAHPRQSLFLEKMSCLRWDSNPRHSILYTLYSRQSALPTELPRQLSWLGPNLTSHSTPDEQANMYMYTHYYVCILHVCCTCNSNDGGLSNSGSSDGLFGFHSRRGRLRRSLHSITLGLNAPTTAVCAPDSHCRH